MIRHLAMLLAIPLVGCVTMGGAANLPSGDTKNWTTYQVEMSDQVVRFTIPPGESIDFPIYPIPRSIGLAQPNTFDRAETGPDLLRRFWDYRASRFATVDGTLRAIIGLRRSERVLDSVNALAATLEDNARLVRAKEVMEGGVGGPPDSMRFEPAIVAGKSGLLVHHQTSPSHYVVTLDPHHYLTIFVDGSSVTRPGWRGDARAAANAIFNSIRIEPRNSKWASGSRAHDPDQESWASPRMRSVSRWRNRACQGFRSCIAIHHV